MKSVMCYLEYNERYLKKIVKGVPSRGEGGSTTWDGGPNMFFLYEPSLISLILGQCIEIWHN